MQFAVAHAPAVDMVGPFNDHQKKHAPRVLFYAGDRALLSGPARVAVVGARAASPLGLRRAARLARELVDQGVCIVSGLAEGVDTVAHTTAIDCGGRTIAVVGHPLDKCYPPGNRALQDLIAREHLLLSQFASGTPILKGNFPQRNRTMALIADATVIVEATDTSGALSQGWEALRLNRPLFVMRSVMQNPDLKWPQAMAHYGAKELVDTRQVMLAIPPDHAPFDGQPF